MEVLIFEGVCSDQAGEDVMECDIWVSDGEFLLSVEIDGMMEKANDCQRGG